MSVSSFKGGPCLVAEAARILGVSEARVRVLANQGRLGGRKHGPIWVFSISEITDFQRRPAGRPRKEAKE